MAGEWGLQDFVNDFARGIAVVDAEAPIAVSSRSKLAYQAGIGPHTEAQTVKMVMAWLSTTRKEAYAHYQLGVPYGDGTRQACDLCFGVPPDWQWALEVKMLRLMGDNGKPNDNILMHILSPYPEHRSALTDCEKLLRARLGTRKAVVIYGYEYEKWPMEPAIEAFERLASARVKLGRRFSASFGGLVHPVHQQGQVIAWELHS